MSRGHVFAALFACATAAIICGVASADPVSLDLTELPEPAVSTASLVTYPAALPALGEVLAPPAVVADSDLASVGSIDAAAPVSPTTPTLVVDDDLQQCPRADFTTSAGIQLAVAAALPGTTIEVCAGTYTPVTVSKSVTLYHSVQHGQATQCSASLVPDPTKDAIVDAAGTATPGFNLQASSVVLYGFTVQNTVNFAGIYTSAAFSGYQLLSNVIQRNTFGIYLHGAGAAQTVVSHNCIRDNNEPGAASGDGIYSDQGLHNALVDENYVTRQNSAAMVFALNQSDLTITHNDDIEGNTIVLVDVQGAYVAYNHLLRTGGSGIFVGGGVTGADVAYNLIESPGGTGIIASRSFFPSPNVVTVEKNHIAGSPFDGIRFDGTSNSTIANNKSERNTRDGIRLINASNTNSVHDNLSRDNGRDGMRVDPAGSAGSTIQQNQMLGNGEHDCHDDTAGAGTGGTANFWIKDLGKTQNRPGLCKNATP